MTSAQVVETSAANNSSFQNYPYPDDHTIPTVWTSQKHLDTVNHIILLKMLEAYGVGGLPLK